jgi:hypothetical protein
MKLKTTGNKVRIAVAGAGSIGRGHVVMVVPVRAASAIDSVTRRF